MGDKGLSALILGASGLTGGLVVQHLLNDERYTKLTILGRASCGITHPKLNEIIGDLRQIDQFASHFTVDHVFCCIGTTKKKTPDPTIYHSIDVGIPVSAARIAALKGVRSFAVVSAIGADLKSRFSYNRMKGEMEEGVLKSNIPSIYILRPSIISGNRNEYRFGERFGLVIFKVLGFLLIGKLKKYKAISADSIAQKMIELSNSGKPTEIVESDRIA